MALGKRGLWGACLLTGSLFRCSVGFSFWGDSRGSKEFVGELSGLLKPMEESRLSQISEP